MQKVFSFDIIIKFSYYFIQKYCIIIVLKGGGKMNITKSTKIEDKILNRLEEIDKQYDNLIEQRKNQFSIDLDNNERKSKASIEKTESNINEKKSKYNNILSDIDTEVTNLNSKKELYINDLISTLEEKNKKLENSKKEIKNNYDQELNKLITYATSIKEILEASIHKIKISQKFSVLNSINNNNLEIEKIRTQQQDSQVKYTNELKRNKENLHFIATKVNDIVKQIKKNYIEKEDSLKRENEFSVYKLNEKIKELQTKLVEEQKPILNEFKIEFEECDREMLTIRNKYEADINEIDNIYKSKISITKQKILYLVKKQKMNIDEKNLYTNLKQELNDLKKEAYNKQMSIENIYKKDLLKLQVRQKESEVKKNNAISLIKAKIDFEIIEIQETIKYNNQISSIKNKLLKIDEIVEIAKAEIELNKNEATKTKIDNITSSTLASTNAVYEHQINLLKLINQNLSDNEEIKKTTN